MLVMTIALGLAAPSLGHGQVGGNVGYSQSGVKAKAEQNERNKRVLSQHELPPSGTSMFVEASVLMNVKADEYVAVFGIVQEGETVADCSRKMETTIQEFSGALKPLGVVGEDLFVDFVAQNKIYGFEVSGEVAREKLVGFELKKNVLIHYKDHALLDKFLVAAARSNIFDLIKVDSIVNDTARVQEALSEEAARILKRKTSRYEKLLGITLKPPAQVYADRFAVYDPTEMYDSYTAYESEEMTHAAAIRQKSTTQGARKSRTFFFNGLNVDGFDEVIHPVVLEPVMQFTLYLKVKYEFEKASTR
ncbi:MAG: hypothetical protein NVSMB9_12340 [Isosphaeraceae bacterium]